MLGEINQRKTNTSDLIKQNSPETENRLAVDGGQARGMRKTGQGGQKAKTSRYTFWEVMYNTVIIDNYIKIILYYRYQT